jgi:methylmalonyl-CoA mutase C-terminal domain/subunit
MDGHNRGVRLVARSLRDAGCEVIYLGIRRSLAEIAMTAAQEDVNVVGLSLLSGAHVALCRSLRAELNKVGLDDVPLMCGGIIPDSDFEELGRIGVEAIFTPGTPMETITKSVFDLCAERQKRIELSIYPSDEKKGEKG